MAAKTSIKQKEIQIQKPAQSLTAFQRAVASGIDERSNLMKRFIIISIAVLVGIAVVVFWNMWRSHRVEQHETALSALISEVEGSFSIPASPAEREQRMRSTLPRLEELARVAPGASKNITNGILSVWKLELDGVGGTLPAPTDPWSRLRLAQRYIVLGQASEASDLISVLHKNAKSNRAWAQIYWSTLMQIRQLEGNREQALKDYTEYREIFKDKADLDAMDKILKTI